MTGLVDYGARFTQCLASRDRAAATVLLREVRTALATGGASGPGFQDDMSKLAEIAGVPLGKVAIGGTERMEKYVRLASGKVIPQHLEDQAQRALQRHKNARGGAAKAAAWRDVEMVQRWIAQALAGQTAPQRHPKRSFTR